MTAPLKAGCIEIRGARQNNLVGVGVDPGYGVRPPAYNNWRGAYGGYHQGWANGYWHGYHNNPNWNWGSFAVGATTGVAAWAVGSSIYGWGYAPYANPYYVAGASGSQWTLEQNESLFKAGAIAERDLKSSQQAVATARARLAAAQARLRASGNEARDTRVVAPSSGVVEKRLVDGGVHLARGAPMFTIVRSGTLELAAAVPARQATALREGQVVHFVADARRFDGTVARVSPTIDPATRAVTVYVQVPNPGNTLRGGTFATGRVVSRTLANVLAVPTGALRQGQEDGKPFVYRIDGKTLNVAPVQLGAVDEQLGVAQVTEGLQNGDKVIVGNVGTLGRGMQVTIAGAERQQVRRP